ncbi:hypothetical protein NXS19_004564 [Fusarium pseudograminearum]|uniref:WGS project CBMD000000000 data, contig CS3427_c001335 n=1 Tax=Fusarium pseudograminearum CS3427 TaxID=1318457 RepID=A0A096PCZ3_FUSPS|nr:hypothetical protein NXS19_004564 [Fusarium pseudograminearum]CEG02558.1 unnamed protein product [Fusarium pseudograminearum CS3427]
MLEKGQNITIGSRSSLPLHIDVQQPRDEPHAQQEESLDESPPHDLREVIRLQAVAISALEKSTRLLGESIALLQNHTQEDRNDPGTSARREAIHDDIKSANTSQPSRVASMAFELPNNPRKNASHVHTCNLENITVGKESQQTIILEGAGSIQARNIATGDGSVQLIGRLNDVTLQKIARSWNGDSGDN